MQYSERDRALDIEGKIASDQKFLDRRSNTGLLPKALEDQYRSDGQRLGRHIALAREDQQRLFRKSRQRTDRGLNATLFLQLVHPPDGGQNPLFDLTGFLYEKLSAKITGQVFKISQSNLFYL